MGEIINRLKRGYQAAKAFISPGRYMTAEGTHVVCPHCKNDKFEEGTVQLNTTGAPFLNMDWFNKSASILICARCANAQWYYEAPKKVRYNFTGNKV